jgi:hypothetical protein
MGGSRSAKYGTSPIHGRTAGYETADSTSPRASRADASHRRWAWAARRTRPRRTRRETSAAHPLARCRGAGRVDRPAHPARRWGTHGAACGVFPAWNRQQPAATMGFPTPDTGGPMRLIGRKRSDEVVEERCPHCSEPVPEGAEECMMCGEDLKPLRGATGSREDEPPANAPSSPYAGSDA